MAHDAITTACPPGPALEERPLMTEAQARSLERTFKVLANGTRLRMLHALLRRGELCVNDLAALLRLAPTAVSNQLRLLAAGGIVDYRREGQKLYYRVLDPCTASLLDHAWCHTECSEARA